MASATGETQASEDLDEVVDQAGTAEEAGNDRRPAPRGYFPSTIGLSFLVDVEVREHQPTDLRVVCANFDCDFNGDPHLPIVNGDDPLYRRLPAPPVVTVEKFATLPWTGESGTLLGGADRYADKGFYGVSVPGVGKQMESPLHSPDLIIQDNLHPSSGPLGTRAGLQAGTDRGRTVERAVRARWASAEAQGGGSVSNTLPTARATAGTD